MLSKILRKATVCNFASSEKEGRQEGKFSRCNRSFCQTLLVKPTIIAESYVSLQTRYTCKVLNGSPLHHLVLIITRSCVTQCGKILREKVFVIEQEISYRDGIKRKGDEIGMGYMKRGQ